MYEKGTVRSIETLDDFNLILYKAIAQQDTSSTMPGTLWKKKEKQVHLKFINSTANEMDIVL